MKNTRLLALLKLAFFVGLCSAPLKAEKPRADATARCNIVFIFVDDQGYYDLGCYGATEIQTPRIDAMATAGTRFTDYYAAAPICSPSRAGLLTGCYPRRVGNHVWVHRADSKTGIHPDELTIAELLQDHGYATACIGKWHLGFHEPFLPKSQGFDHNVGRIFDSLKRLGIDGNTIVIYASDNGRGPGRTPDQEIRGHKLSTYEGGIRVPAIAWGPGLGLQAGVESAAVVRAMDWYPTLATFAGIKVPPGRVIDGRDISPLLKGETRFVPHPGMKKSLNAPVPMRRSWNPDGEWAPIVHRNEYNDAFFYHGSQGALAAVRWRNWKLYLNPSLQLYDLAKDPSETRLTRNRDILRKLRGMAVLFQEEMRRDARPAGEAPLPFQADGRTEIPATTRNRLDAKPDVTYARYGDRTLEMDIYRPKGTWGQLPAVLCVHGGGWAKGGRINHAKVAQAIAARGYVAATISYRLSGEAPFPAQIQDCKAAVRFLRANAATYGIDPGKIGAIGHSAGGHLTALLAASAGAKELEGDGGNASVSSAIQAAVPMGAQTDFLSERTREVSKTKEIWQKFLTGSQEEQPATYRLASPLHHLDKSDPPCWFITGEEDDPSTHADAFRKRMGELGIRSGLKVIADAPHPFLVKQAWFDEMVEAAATFLEETLKQKDIVADDPSVRRRSRHGR